MMLLSSPSKKGKLSIDDVEVQENMEAQENTVIAVDE
jgi:hypothetical protein